MWVKSMLPSFTRWMGWGGLARSGSSVRTWQMRRALARLMATTTTIMESIIRDIRMLIT